MKVLYRLISWFIVISILLPIVVIVIYSLSNGWFFPDLFPNTVGFESWKTMFSPRYRMGLALVNSMSIALMVSFISLCVSLPAVIVVKRYVFLRPLLFIPILMPPLAVVLGVFEFFVFVGLANTYTGLICTHTLISIPFAIYILDGACSDEVLAFAEQSRILGANWFVRLRCIYFPMMLPSIVYTAAMVFFLSWHQYLPNLVLAGSRIPTIAVQLLNFIYAGNTSLSGVVALLFLFPAILITIVHRKLIRQVPWLV